MEGPEPGEPAYAARAVAGRGPSTRGAAALAVILASALALAVAKPWDAGMTVPAAGPTAGAGASAAPPSSAASLAPTARPDPRLPRPNAVARALRPHDEWGVRVIVGGETPRELWLAAPMPMPDGIPTLDESYVRALVVRAQDRPVSLIGLTTPPDVVPVAVRVAVARPLGRTARVELREIRVRRFDGLERLFAPVASDDWSPGIYQFRIDLGERSTAITIAIFAGPAREPPVR